MQSGDMLPLSRKCYVSRLYWLPFRGTYCNKPIDTAENTSVVLYGCTVIGSQYYSASRDTANKY